MDLNPGEVLCDRCDGKGNAVVGYKIDNIDSTKEFEVLELCPKCRGWGKLDWIDNVVGHKQSSFTIYRQRVTPTEKEMKEGYTYKFSK